MPRTSISDPLGIAGIAVPEGAGLIGITLCPGKKGPSEYGEEWDRDLAADIAAIREWRAGAVLCLMEAHELRHLGVERLPEAVREAGMEWFHLPIRDVDVPDDAFRAGWRTTGEALRGLLRGGGRLLVHCRGGLGRSGTIAAQLLVEMGLAPAEAVARVRAARPRAIETPAQERYVLRLARA